MFTLCLIMFQDKCHSGGWVNLSRVITARIVIYYDRFDSLTSKSLNQLYVITAKTLIYYSCKNVYFSHFL